MSEHSSSVFNNSCVKPPRNPLNTNEPLPIYEQKLLNELQNEVTKLKLDATDSPDVKEDNFKSFMEFYESIPEYDDVNHLSNREFYKKIEMLKEKQKTIYNNMRHNEAKTNWIDNYCTEERPRNKKASNKPFCVTPILSKSPKFTDNTTADSDDNKEAATKPSSRRSVRIETPISDKLLLSSPDDDFYHKASWRTHDEEAPTPDFDDFEHKISKSAPSSPCKSAKQNVVGWKDSITIPKPFEMTIKDEERQIVDELMSKTAKNNSKAEMFRANPVPIESQIPLFHQLMADQEQKNYIVRERSKAALTSQMRPFSFTRRDEELQKLTKNLSKSSPSLFLDDPPIKVKKFKAKPIPKNLFSNYIYRKMHEDEFYRALQKKIRAEEMLRAASLPPSMAKREKSALKFDVCPRSYRILSDEKQNNKGSKGKKSQNYNFDKQLEALKQDFLKSSKKRNKKLRNSSSACSSSIRTTSSMDLAVNRSNLAAVLRVQSARKRMEMDMCRKLEEAKLKEEARWREKLMRKKPVWQALAYSHEEDLAMRLQLRRDEEKLRSEEHRMRMELMLGRVNRQPTLFERQTKLNYSRDELIEKLHEDYRVKNRRKSVNDAAIQALIDEELDSASSNTKESLQQDNKDKCESLSSEEN